MMVRETSNIVENPPQEDWTVWLKEQRRTAVNIILMIVAGLGLFGVTYSYYQLLKGLSQNFLFYAAAFVIIIGLILISWRVSEKPVATALIVFVFLFSAYSFYLGWLASGARTFFVMSVVLATLFLYPRAGFVVAGSALITYILFALAYGLGWIPLPQLPDPTTPTPMFIEGLGFTISLAVVSISQWYFGQGLKAASRANLQAQRSRSGFHNIVERSPDGILVTDLNGRVLFVNASAERFFGKNRSEWIGGASGIPHHTGDIIELPIRRPDGSAGIAELRLEDTEWEGVPAYLAILRDITDRKQAETEREKLIADLAAKNTELERFTYTVSHDLKSPLVTITGFLGYLEKDARSGNFGRVHRDIDRITAAVEKMQNLLKDLLELSRVGRLLNPPVLMPFTQVVEEALALVHGALVERGAIVQVSGDLPFVYGDRAQLVEVVQNLVDNAAKFMGDQPAPLIEIGCSGSDAEGSPILYVRDNGIGIEPRFHERVFGLFDKLDPQTEGTGVGLALVKRIVEVHGGRVWVESKGGGQGSTFHFSVKIPGSVSLANTL